MEEQHSYECLVAQTALVIPFHWGDVGRAPGEKSWLARYLLMDKLLQRFVVHPDTGQHEFLWEMNRTIPFEIGELSAYLKHILGWGDAVKYYQENRTAKEKAFGVGGHSPSCRADSRCQHGARTGTARPSTSTTNGKTRNGNGEEELMEEVVGGEDTKSFENMEVWKCQRLVLADNVRRMVFPHTRLWAHAEADKVSIESSSNTLDGYPHEEKDAGERVSLQVNVTKVELVLYPLGNGILVFHVDWRPDPTRPLSLDQLRSWLYMAKFQHKVRGIFYGWTLGQATRPPSGSYSGAHSDSLGKLARSIYGGSCVSLSCIGNWLVHLPHEDSLHPPRRISYSAYAYHHSVVVIDKQPSKEDLREYLRHLTRAFNANTMTPDVLLPEAMHQHSLEEILPHRRNRYLGVSVEGNVSFSWLTEGANPQFECVTWPKVYQGIYLLLDVHTRGEGSVLSELSRMSAKVAEHMHLTAFEKLEKDRLKMRAVAMQMIKYSLSLTSDVCSGMSEYAQYFTTVRKVLGIPSGKQKVREEIEHVLNIVESVYVEEQRRKKREEKKQAKEKELAQHKIESIKEGRRQRFETLISITGTVMLPLMLVSGMMGMNLHDLPDPGFWPLLGYTLLVMLFLFLLLMLWYSRLLRRFWARFAALSEYERVMNEPEEEEFEGEDKYDLHDDSSPLHGLGHSPRPESDTTPLLSDRG